MTDSTRSFDIRQYAESLITDKKRRNKLLGYAFKWYRIRSADAEDLLQETIYRLLSYPGYIMNPEAYAYSVFRNLCKRFNSIGAIEGVAQSPTPEAGGNPAVVERLHAEMAVREGLARISRRCRQVLKAYYLQEMNLREVARVAHLADSSAAKTINRCLRKLQECFG